VEEGFSESDWSGFNWEPNKRTEMLKMTLFLSNAFNYFQELLLHYGLLFKMISVLCELVTELHIKLRGSNPKFMLFNKKTSSILN
jgi:hypothetical protein